MTLFKLYNHTSPYFIISYIICPSVVASVDVRKPFLCISRNLPITQLVYYWDFWVNHFCWISRHFKLDAICTRVFHSLYLGSLLMYRYFAILPIFAILTLKLVKFILTIFRPFDITGWVKKHHSIFPLISPKVMVVLSKLREAKLIEQIRELHRAWEWPNCQLSAFVFHMLFAWLSLWYHKHLKS